MKEKFNLFNLKKKPDTETRERNTEKSEETLNLETKISLLKSK